MTMGNAVRLAKTNTDRADMNATFCIPWATMKHATISGKKIQLGKKEESQMQTYTVPHTFLDPNMQGQQCYANIAAKQSDILTTQPNKPKANVVEGSGQKIVDNSVMERLEQYIISQTRPPNSTGSDSPRTEVRYIFLQPGQKVSDLNLLPVRTNQELGKGAGQPVHPQVMYLNKSNPVNRFPISPTNSPISKVQSEMRASPASGLAASSPTLLPSLSASEPINSESVAPDRAKDVVPGTEDKYRTPGSSFRNKNGNIKRPMNAFMVWARSYRSKLASHFQGDTNSQISIKLGDIWNSLTPEEKQPYYEEAEKIKNQHKKEFPGWVYRPSPSKKRHEDSATHHLLWARFTEGSSSATLAAMANAAANQAPLDSIQVKQELVQSNQVTVKSESGEDKGHMAKTGIVKEQSGSEQTPLQKGEQTTGQLASGAPILLKPGDSSMTSSITSGEKKQPQKSATLKVLKAKLCGQSSECRKILTEDKSTIDNGKSSPRKSKSKTHKSASKPHPSTEQKGSGKLPKDRAPRITGKKKKQKNPVEKRKDDRYIFDLRSPVTPPSTPRSVDGLDTPKNSQGEKMKQILVDNPIATVANANSADTEESKWKASENSRWSKPDLATEDTWSFPFPPHQYGPFDHLSPRDVPSDEILGSGRLVRESNEDLTRPEKVTSDLILNVQGWKSFLASSESTSKLTDDDVGNLFNPKHCGHGPECQVCTSDIDLAPKPVRETLQTRMELIESAYGDPNVCLDVEVRTEAFKPEKMGSEVDEIAGSVYQALLALEDSQSKSQHDKGTPPTAETSHVNVDNLKVNTDTKTVLSVTQKYDDIVTEPVVSTLGAEVCVEGDECSEEEERGVRFVDISLSTKNTTHVVFKGNPYSSYHSNESSDHNVVTEIDQLEKTCKLGGRLRKCDSKRKLTQIYRTDDNTHGTDQDRTQSKLAPEIFPLTPLRYSDPERQSRYEMYHRKIQLQDDISKYKLFDTNRSAKSSRSARLKSAQLTRDGQSMKLGVFDEEGNKKGSCESLGNIDSRSSLDIDDIEGIEGTGISMMTRGNNSRANRKSPHSRRVAFYMDDGRKTRGKKKTSKRSIVREPENSEPESDLCQGDTVAGIPESSSPHTVQMELLRTIVGKDKEGMETSMVGETFDLSDVYSWNVRHDSRTRSHIRSKIYVQRQTLPDLPRRKATSAAVRSSRNKHRSGT